MAIELKAASTRVSPGLRETQIQVEAPGLLQVPRGNERVNGSDAKRRHGAACVCEALPCLFRPSDCGVNCQRVVRSVPSPRTSIPEAPSDRALSETNARAGTANRMSKGAPSLMPPKCQYRSASGACTPMLHSPDGPHHAPAAQIRSDRTPGGIEQHPGNRALHPVPVAMPYRPRRELEMGMRFHTPMLA